MTDKADEYIAKAPTLTIFDGLVKAKSVLTNNKNILVSVSGGADSDCMIDIVENLIPRDGEHDVTYVWFDTGVEMDATKRHLSFLEEKYDIKIHRERGKMQVTEAVRNDGNITSQNNRGSFVALDEEVLAAIATLKNAVNARL